MPEIQRYRCLKTSYFRPDPHDARLVPDPNGTWVEWSDASEMIEAIDRRHREVRDAIAGERDAAKAELMRAGSFMLTCKKRNTSEWMQEAAARIRSLADVLGELNVKIEYVEEISGNGVLVQTML